MDDISKQIDKAIANMKSEVSRIVHEKTSDRAAQVLAALDGEIGQVFENRSGKTQAELTGEVAAAATRAGVDLEESKIHEVVGLIVKGEKPEFVPDIRVEGLE